MIYHDDTDKPTHARHQHLLGLLLLPLRLTSTIDLSQLPLQILDDTRKVRTTLLNGAVSVTRHPLLATVEGALKVLASRLLVVILIAQSVFRPVEHV